MKGQEFRLRLLGAFTLTGSDGATIPITSKKSRAILAMTAMAEDGRRMRSWIQEMLWTSRGHEQAQASLRRELANLRNALEAAGANFFQISRDTIEVDPNRLTVDALAFMSGVEANAAPSEFLEGMEIRDADGFNLWLRAQREEIDRLKRQQAPSLLRPKVATPNSAKPSIGVVAFDSLSETADHAHLTAGICEQVFTALSRYSTLCVVWDGQPSARDAPSSPAALLERCADLNVRYLLIGSVQTVGGRTRVGVRLVDGFNGATVWAERLESATIDVFALQDRIAALVAPQVDSSIEKNERFVALQQPVSTPNAWHLYWRANAEFRNWTPEGMHAAIKLAEDVLALEPRNAWAASLAAFCNATCYCFNWTEDRANARSRAVAFIEAALQADNDDPFVLGYCAGALLNINGDKKLAERLIDRAVEIHPNAASTLFWGGWVDICAGNGMRARDRFETVMRTNPRSAVRPFSVAGLGLCLLAEGRAEEAVERLEEAHRILPANPITQAGLALAYAYTNRHTLAHHLASQLRETGNLDIVLGLFPDQQSQAVLIESSESRKASRELLM